MRVALLAWCSGLTAACIRGARAGGADPVAVFTEREAPAGLRAPEVDGVPVHTVAGPAEGWLERVRATRPDRVLVTGWPRRLPPLDALAALGALNVHPSLLPRHRGRAPVFWTVLAGDTEAGVTLHRLTDALDAGPVVLQGRIPVPAGATTASLEASLDALAGSLVDRLCRLGPTTPAPAPQRGTPSAAPTPGAADGALRWDARAEDLERCIRACNGAIEATASWHGMKIVVLGAERATSRSEQAPGTVVSVDARAVVVATGDGDLALCRFAFLHRLLGAGDLAAQLGLARGERLGDG